MKIWNNYLKEMTIASRGFYFYIELFIAVIVLLGLILVVPADHAAIAKEVVFPDFSEQKFEELANQKEGKGYTERQEDEVFKVKPTTLTYFEEETGQKITKEFTDKKKIKAKQYYYYDPLTGKHTKTKYIVDNFDDMMRIAYAKKYFGTEMWFDENEMDHYHSVLFGYETDRYQNIIKASHGTVDTIELVRTMEAEKESTIQLKPIETLDNRQQYVPLLLVFMNGFLGIMIIIAYISVDKSEGVLKALSVAPFSVGSYLTSKIMVALTTAILSSLIITLPVIGFQLHFIWFLVALLALCIASSIVGIWISTFFKDLKSSFGMLLIVALITMVPAISYIVPSFHPQWIEWFPTYHMLEMMKETMLVSCDTSYVLIVSGTLFIFSGFLYLVSKNRYKKILGA